MSDEQKKYLIVSLHDFHPASLDLIREQIEVLECLGVKNTSILAVPNFHHESSLCDDKASLAFLDHRYGLGDDLVLHGFYHQGEHAEQDNFKDIFFKSLYTANEAEFLNLEDDVFLKRVDEGRALWEKRNWALDGFIAPAWLMPHKRDHDLANLGFCYTTRLDGIYLLNIKRKIMTQSLCYSTRSMWRRMLSRRWNPYLLHKLLKQNAKVIRLSLHPNDLNWRMNRAQIIQMVELILANGYEPLTYASYAKV
ncbi:MAG: polysaccharide deacetylase family protein [Verrucomicrobiota bacterium]